MRHHQKQFFHYAGGKDRSYFVQNSTPPQHLSTPVNSLPIQHFRYYCTACYSTSSGTTTLWTAAPTFGSLLCLASPPSSIGCYEEVNILDKALETHHGSLALLHPVLFVQHMYRIWKTHGDRQLPHQSTSQDCTIGGSGSR